jgi:hypothetical protein
MPRGSQQSSGFAATRSPGATVRTARPTSTTSPTFSWPRTKGNDEKGEVEGLACSEITLRSLPQIPPSRVRIRTQCSSGSTGAATSPNVVQA